MKPLLLAVVCLFPLVSWAAAPSTSVDIGPVGAAGSTSVANGVYTVRASGRDVWGTQDEFRFVYAALTGDGEVTARVDSLDAWENWSKAGVMIRETLSPSSRYAFAILSFGRGASFQYRAAFAAEAQASGSADGVTRAPQWVRMRRVGNVFTAFVSADAQTWRQQGSSVTIAMGASVYAGLAFTSYSAAALATATFSNANVGSAAGTPPPTSPPPTPPPPTSPPPTPPSSSPLELTTSVDIGGVNVAGSTSSSSGVYTVRAAGSDVWGTQDQFRFVYASLGGDGEITARVDSLATWENWSKAGVMIRETLTPGSRFAFAILSGGHGTSFQYRAATGGQAAESGDADEVTRAPHWVRLRRAGNVFTAQVSSDGQNWRQQGGNVTIAMGANVYVGLALGSHSASALATGVFSNVRLTAASGAPAVNRPPAISGTPPASATVGSAYAFTPNATDADGDTLTFSIANRPAWASFDTRTGRLAGTPSASHAGTYQTIVISVSDGQAAATLAPFTITVGGTSSNRAPTISGTPSTTVVQGTAYSFQPNAVDPDGDTLTFTISNAPAWANFNTSTGRLQGTPGAGDVGTYGNIVIRVSDGRATTSLASFGIQVLAVASGSATLSWTPPTANTDGSALTNLAGYRVYWGTDPAALGRSVALNTPGLTSYVVENLAPGTHYFAITAVNGAGVESARSNMASKTIR